MLTIRSINPLPATHLDSDYQARTRLLDAYNREIIGGPQWDGDPESEHAAVRLDTEHQRHRWLAEIDGHSVGFANLTVNTVDAPDAGDALVFVSPEHRGRGIGAALLDVVGEQAASLGLARLESWIATPVPQGETVRPNHGVGELPADHPGVRLALRDGFKLGQVERISRYDAAKPLVDPKDALREAESVAGEDYEVISWKGQTPDELQEGVAVLLQRMSVDPPSGDMTKAETTWTAERVRERDERNLISNRFYRAAVRHLPTGQIVALNELLRDRSNADAFIDQWDTVVLPEHRGHRLGMAVKAANILQVREAEPTATAIITWNAEENRHMLRVNEELGFREILRRGGFEKRLAPEG
ncbi:MAG: GNAT family N-acetyltransferase [Propionibacteriaceae bacterium]|nr:GNAT family N-acetyltransferase [Propionibacteriaceae bacterium]